MIISHPIDTICKKIKQEEKNKEYATWNMVAFDPITRTLVAPNWLNRVVKQKLTYFVIKNKPGFIGKAIHTGFELKVNDLEQKWELNFMVRYEISCPKNREGIFLSAMENHSELGKEFDRLVTRHVRDVTLDAIKKHPPDNFDAWLRDIEEQVTQQVTLATGLILVVSLSTVSDSSVLKDQIIDHPLLEINLRDFSQHQRLSIKLYLQLDENKRGLSMIRDRRQTSLSEQTSEAVCRYLASGAMDANTFFTALRDKSFNKLIQEHLEPKLQQVGQRLLKVETTLHEPPVLELLDDLEEIVHVQIIDFPQTVHVHTQAHARLKSYVTYKMADGPDLRQWFKEKADQVIKQVLFHQTYEDVLAKFLPIKENIKTRMQAEAARIGYAIYLLVTKTNLGPEKLLEEFILEQDSVEFKTRSSDAVVKFGLHINGRLQDLSMVSHLLRNPSLSCEKVMLDKAVDKMKSILLGMDPERVYMSFEFSDQPDEKPVESILIEALIELLKKTYNATAVEVKIMTKPSPITEKLGNLLKKSGSIQCALQPVGCDYAYPVTADFRVNGVHPQGWQIFYQKEFGMDEIAEDLKKFYQARFSQFSEAQLRDGMLSQAKFESLFNDFGRQQIIKIFGIVVTVYNVLKGISAGEEKQFQWERDKREKLYKEKEKDMQLQIYVAEMRRKKYQDDLEQRQSFDLAFRNNIGEQLLNNLLTDPAFLESDTTQQILQAFQQDGDVPNSQSLDDVVNFVSRMTEKLADQTHVPPGGTSLIGIVQRDFPLA